MMELSERFKDNPIRPGKECVRLDVDISNGVLQTTDRIIDSHTMRRKTELCLLTYWQCHLNTLGKAKKLGEILEILILTTEKAIVSSF